LLNGLETNKRDVLIVFFLFIVCQSRIVFKD